MILGEAMPSHTVTERKKKKKLTGMGSVFQQLVPGQIAKKLFGKSIQALTTVQKKALRERVARKKKK